MLQHHFGQENVYFLPVSAQGENVIRSTEEENKDSDQFTFLDESDQLGNSDPNGHSSHQERNSTELGYPPNQKLAEYVFVLPVTLLADHQSEVSFDNQEVLSELEVGVPNAEYQGNGEANAPVSSSE